MGFSFDGSITLGSILNAAVLLIGFVVAFTRIGGRLDLLSLRVQGIEKSLAEAAALDKRFAVFEERVTNHGTAVTQLQKDLNELRRGQGWITQHNRDSVDGEYK